MAEGDNLVYHMAEGDNLVYHMAEGDNLVLSHGIADKIAHFSFKNTHLYKTYTIPKWQKNINKYKKCM
jgi:hypothetical protein